MIALLTATVSGGIVAKGGLVYLDPTFAGGSNEINNPWWALISDQRLVYIEEADDECVVGVLEIRETGDQYPAAVDGVNVREVWDREFIDDVGDCDAGMVDIDSWELLETTYDRYAQDIGGSVWYFGEFTVAFTHDECEHTTTADKGPFFEDSRLDGSWEAGYGIWAAIEDVAILPGIIMLANPKKAQFYFQEFWEDEATDMGKVLNFKDIDGTLFGALSDFYIGHRQFYNFGRRKHDGHVLTFIATQRDGYDCNYDQPSRKADVSPACPLTHSLQEHVPRQNAVINNSGSLRQIERVTGEITDDKVLRKVIGAQIDTDALSLCRREFHPPLCDRLRTILSTESKCAIDGLEKWLFVTTYATVCCTLKGVRRVIRDRLTAFY